MSQSEWDNARCKQLGYLEADAIFFPSNGGKPGEARRFCEQCPIVGLCLETAVREGRTGFWAGTTDGQRRQMSKFVAKSVINYMSHIDEGGRRIYRKVFSPEDQHAWLDEDIEPSLQELVEIEVA